ncbi:TIGR03564 family F420-dependent LLM class oxidoreductase [Jiangella sp. DSM 45060]|uniref:TIGR03564 family F420-dependent LLM class oxidoreductase n=1 Tax=Jiangella sp. DSM 45060 TaxID=1798224 RepID=UPI00087D35CF|nr:TIGR03564 family F420-dependent LLM class oxidoreductase [Jiangella sp. DSM 45060]SDT65243.1 F420-dependent oxidoreductase, MSMEG_4879 family [Jiangella sp. DSM 45060]
MRTGAWIDDDGVSVATVAERARAAAAAGYETVWLSERSGWDPLTLLTAVGAAVPEVQLGTAVVRTHPRHPLSLAAQALTTQAATGGRLRLGVGPSHAPIVEGQYGVPYDRPARHTREYLTALRPLLRGEPVAHAGVTVTVNGQLAGAGVAAPPLLLSALGPVMLRVAGELADGVVTTWAGPRSIGEHVVPALTAAAAAAGRERPAVIAGVCVAVTSDPDGVRDWVQRRFGVAGDLPSYRAQLDREGVRTPAETVVAGDEAAVGRAVRALADAGMDELMVLPVGPAADQARTLEVAATLAR